MLAGDQKKLHSRLIRLLGEITENVDRTFDLDDVEFLAAQRLREVIPSQAVAFFRLYHDLPQILIKKMLHNEADWIYQASIQPMPGLVWECIQENKPIYLQKISSDSTFSQEIDGIPNYPNSSLLYIPMETDNCVVGAIGFYEPNELELSSTEEQQMRMFAGSFAQLLTFMEQRQDLYVENAHLEASQWELLRSRNTLRSLFDNLPDSLYIIDRKYRMIAINAARAKRAGCDQQEVVNKECYEVLYHRSEPCLNCKVHESFYYKRTTHRIERTWEGGEYPQVWEINSYPIFQETDQVMQTILFEKDVTEKNNMETILAQSEKMAAVGTLAAGIAHEINNPLTVILANGQLLQRQLPESDVDQHEAVDLILRAGTRALQVVRNLLHIARKEQYELSETDINLTIETTLQMLKHELMMRDVELIFERSENLPLIMASFDNLQGVWLNLFLNALDAIGTQKERRLRVNTYQLGNEIRVVITDNGQGIPSDNLKRIFDPFFTTKEAGKGTGLGLSICHRIIKQHGGYIKVDSVLGTGTTFTVSLPVY